MPTKLNPEVQRTVCEAIRRGLRIKDGATLAGISYGTVAEWAKKGRNQKHGKYREFSEAIEKAKAEAKEKLIQTLSEAAGLVGDPEGNPSRIVKRTTTLPSGEQSVVVEEIREPAKWAHQLLKSRYPDEFAGLKMAASAKASKKTVGMPDGTTASEKDVTITVEFVAPILEKEA